MSEAAQGWYGLGVLTGIVLVMICLLLMIVIVRGFDRIGADRLPANEQVIEEVPESPRPPERSDGTPVPIDPADPPKIVTYNPTSDKIQRCACHAQRITPGSPVIWWPRPDIPGAVDLYCPSVVDLKERR